MGRLIAAGLWVLVAGFAIVIWSRAIPACGLAPGGLWLHWLQFCPAVAEPVPLDPALRAAAERQQALEAEAAQLELALMARPACTPPRPPEPEPAPPPKPSIPAPSIPDDRWRAGDLSMLEGCWVLHQNGPSDISVTVGGQPETARLQAGRLCFDREGRGRRMERFTYQGQKVTCNVPARARFDGSDRMVVQSKAAPCTGGDVDWRYNDQRGLTCERQNGDTAICRDDERSYRFRRD